MNIGIGLKKLVACMAVVFMFAACSDNMKEPYAPSEPGNEGKGFISIGISTESGEGKSKQGVDDDDGNDVKWEEDHVEKVRMVLYDGTAGVVDPEVKYAFDFCIRSNHDFKPDNFSSTDPSTWAFIDYSDDGFDQASNEHNRGNSRNNFITYAREVEYADYRMLIIINPTEPENNDKRNLVKLTEVGRKLSAIADVYDGQTPSAAVSYDSSELRDKEAGGIAAESYFLMTNMRELFFVSRHKLRSTAELAHIYAHDDREGIRVDVVRMVAKVAVLESEEVELPLLAEVGDFSWDLDVVNKRAYWMRKKPPLIYGEEYESSSISEIYAVDPNFSGWADKPAADRYSEFFYYEDQDPTPEELPHKTGRYKYVLENTMSPVEQDGNVHTRVIIRCIYKPGVINTFGESYYVFEEEDGQGVMKAKVYSLEVMKGLWENRDNPSWMGGPTEALKAAMDAVVAEKGDPDIFISHSQESYMSNGIRYYHNGVNYYIAPVRHFEYLDIDDSGAYGIVRNNYYKMTIDRIKGPGVPVIGSDGDPDNNVEVTFNVSAWNDRDVDFDL